MSGEVTVKVEGINELIRALNRLGRTDINAELKGVMSKAAGHIVGVAQTRMPHQSGAAAGSLRSRARVGGASIAFGGTAAPYEPWLDFGGTTGRGHMAGRGGGAIVRPFEPGGRYIYPAIEESRSVTEHLVLDGVAAAAKKAGFEVRG